MKNVKGLFFLFSLSLFLTFDLMILGAAVRAMDAGLACPDWPLCFGQSVPEFHLGVYFEFIHRALAGLVFIVFAILTIQVFKATPRGHVLRVQSLFGLLILISQVIMGGLTVLKLLQSQIVTTHLALATVFFGNLVIMKKRAEKQLQYKHAFIKLPAVFVIPSVVVFCQILLGGWVATTYSGKVCLDFPTCAGEYFPTFEGPLGIQVIHRLGAYTTAIVVSVFAVWAFRKFRYYKSTSVYIFLMVFAQILIGILNLKFFIPVWLTVLHSAGALLLFRLSLNYLFGTRQKT